ncbi:MAG: hypothetical protein EOO75_07385 [Myxococcales bacterium]|nr:MAG: hypothetical protein EOO75_07385 [Myxococcales bacterium]
MLHLAQHAPEHLGARPHPHPLPRHLQLGDGVRAASPSLLLQGLLLVAVGVAIELGATALVPGVRGRCRVVMVPKKGRALCVGEVDATDAQALLATLPRRG